MRKNLIIGIVIGAILSSVGIVTAQTIIKSNEVTYDNSKSKGSFDNVQDSLDELYSKAGYTGEEYHEDILHGADPVLSGELIPVYLADNGDVYYANTHTKWYSYEYKKWANAVILVDDAYAKNRQDNKDKYSVGDKIDEEDIESYFVWIPRYAYKLWNLEKYTGIIVGNTLNDSSADKSPGNITGKARIIDVTFGTNKYLSGNDYKKLIRDEQTGVFSNPEGLEINNWLVHPAFTLADTEINGFWMGKFETGYNQTNIGQSSITGTDKWTTANAEVDTATSNKIIVKPDVYSWRNINVANAFNYSKDYKTDLKSHMLKNTEWGAVAYLTHSKYGKGSEPNINNASDYKTGYSALNSAENTSPGESDLSSSSLNEPYNTATGYLASSTGNITGVYDIVGRTYENVAAIMTNGNITASGFDASDLETQKKEGYIDVYSSDCNTTTYDKTILGDAIGEIGPFYNFRDGDGGSRHHSSWYQDIAYFIEPNRPWIDRSGSHADGIEAGLFFFGRNNGSAAYASGFRLALAP